MAGIRWSSPDARSRKEAIVEHGQPVALRMARLGDLFAIVLEPGNSFIHLVQDPEACVEAFGMDTQPVVYIEAAVSTSLWRPRAYTADAEGAAL